MNLIRPFLVMSAYTKDNTPEANKLRHKALLSQLQKYPKFSIREVDGNYEGDNEKAILIYWHKDLEEIIQSLCVQYNQESYLHVEASGYGSLMDTTGKQLTKLAVLKCNNAANKNYFKLGEAKYTCNFA